MSAKYVVCPACEGEGTVDNFGPMTPADLDEWFGNGDERDEFLSDYMAGRIGRANCEWCEGKRVVPAVDEYGEEAEAAYKDHLDDLAIQRAEMGGWGY